MKGTTNIVNKKVNEIERINISLLTNQLSHADILGTTFTLTYGNYTKSYTWDGLSITIEIPAYVTYTITFSNVASYKKPSDITYVAQAGNSRTLNAIYLTCALTVNVVGSGATPSGYTITVKDSSGNTLGTQTTSSKVYKIPFGTSYTVSASAVSGYNAVSSLSGIANVESNTITITYVYSPAIDLSKQDIYGTVISLTTANCYVVREVGTYKIPLVFGNALKNGSTNSAAYTKIKGTFSHDFVDYNGTVVTSPYIESVSGTASSAQLSIADTDGIFTDISIVNGSPCRYLLFKVNSVPATGANGVLSIKNSSGVIMWSWHIWVWEDDLSPVEITNATGVKYNILPVNLASKWDNDSKTHIKNWYYQFGRPTPMLCPSAYNSTKNHASYGALNYAIGSTASDIQTGIKNPTVFYRYNSSSNYNWFQTNSGKTYNLWDAACTSTGNSDNDVVKTIYDPCPVGFKMPNGNTFTGFNIINEANSIVKFIRYSGDSTGVGFSMPGFRDWNTGTLNNVGSYGYVWLSSAHSQKYAYHLTFRSNYVSPQYYDSSVRAYGFSVRPVQE